MNFKLASVIAFAVCQIYPTSAQQQGTNPTQALLPGGWVRPLYAAAAEAWREYFIRAQQATNQLYQQWANMSGNPLSNAMGGLGGLYGIGNLAQSGSNNQPPRPLQGIFSPVPTPQSGLQLSELLPVSERPGKQDAKVQAPLQDPVQEPRPQLGVYPQSVPIQPQTHARPQNQNQLKPSQIVQPPIQQVSPLQTQAAPVHVSQPQAQLQSNIPSQIPVRPLQTVGQAANAAGLFGSSNPLGWMG